MKERRRDYFLVAGVFRKVYLKSQKARYRTTGELFRDLIKEFTLMLQEDNPKFNPAKFMQYVRTGDC